MDSVGKKPSSVGTRSRMSVGLWTVMRVGDVFMKRPFWAVG
jgi:hypothetical protein